MLRDPLTHFVLLGALVFGAWQYLNPAPPDADPRTIVIDRNSLLRFVMFRTRSFDEAEAAERMAGFSDEVFEDIVNEYVREEALHRSALEMGLDADDYVMRQRLVQKVEYLAEGSAETAAEPDEAVLRGFYAAHAADYVAPPTATFTHVFFSIAKRREAEALARAKETLHELNARTVSFDGATAWGERFAYHVNYVDRTAEEIASHFGAEMTAALFNLVPDAVRWQGPLRSEHGVHLVLLTKAAPATQRPFEEVRADVLREWQTIDERRRKDEFIASIVANYRIERMADLRGSSAP